MVIIIASIFIKYYAENVKKQIDDYIYPTQYSEWVEKYSTEYEVDPNLIYAVIKTESGFDSKAVSSVGAIGLMQITEITFDWIKMKNFSGEDVIFDDLYDAETNIHFGTFLISECLKRYGDISTAVAAYHSGWGTVDELLNDEKYALNENTLKEFPYNQMQHYVYKINKNYDEYLNKGENNNE